MYLLAFIFLVLWSTVGSFDSAYFHDKKFSLHLYADCKKEHFCHTIRAICFTVIIFSLFYKNFIGVIFWIGCLAIIIDTVFFILDIIAEKNSRKNGEVYLMVNMQLIYFQILFIIALLQQFCWQNFI